MITFLKPNLHANNFLNTEFTRICKKMSLTAGTKWRRYYSFIPFPISTLEGGRWSAQHPGYFVPQKTSYTLCMGGWVCLGNTLDAH